MYARGSGVRHAVAGGAGAGTAAPQGLLQDQVQVALACLAAHERSNAPRYLDVALDLAAIIERSYADPFGGYYDVEAADPLPASQAAMGDRTKHVLDDMLPSSNAATALLLAQLARVTGDQSYRRRAQATLEAFAGSAESSGLRAVTFLTAARETLGKP
jgi:uncharacterized protein YyaL (SSP411 family)